MTTRAPIVILGQCVQGGREVAAAIVGHAIAFFFLIVKNPPVIVGAHVETSDDAD
jgi:hypothetical protein